MVDAPVAMPDASDGGGVVTSDDTVGPSVPCEWFGSSCFVVAALAAAMPTRR